MGLYMLEEEKMGVSSVYSSTTINLWRVGDFWGTGISYSGAIS